MAETKTKKKVASAPKNDVTVKYQQMVQFVKNMFTDIEADIKRATLILHKLEKFDPMQPDTLLLDPQTEETLGDMTLQAYTDDDAQVVE